MRFRASVICMAAVMFLFAASGLQGTTVTLTDLNSSASINWDSASGTGMYSWVVDGANQMFQQWFWWRVDGAAPGEVPLIGTSITGGGRSVEINSVNSLFTARINYTLTGGATGTHTSDISEIISLQNTSTTSALNLHFFQYSDFDLNGSVGGQTVQMSNANTVRQTGPTGGLVLSETVATPVPTHHEVGLFANTLTSLGDGAATTLNDASGPLTGDATWAFEWDVTIAPGGTFLISKDKNLAAVVPEPASVLGLGTVLFLLGSRLRRRKKA